jgi:prophage regulatory protein
VADTNSPKILVRMPGVLKHVPVAKCTLYSWMAKGLFPRPISLGARSVAWDLQEITAWQEKRIKASVSADEE